MKTKRIGLRAPLVALLAVNQTCGMRRAKDAVARSGIAPRCVKYLTIVDDLSEECVEITVDVRGVTMSCAYWTGLPLLGGPQGIQKRQRTEFIRLTLITWAKNRSIKHMLVE